ncbi:hypothetical protein HUT06_23760 [Actinomadura sp. NAK00032]|uniref:hypothetical protein n=1 Tax=Actinomadura sp. NAK00032 TaxID=2742128 RepID=UPI001590EF71|nr:hypothetical protein [Actinomadura sp. NAK00032]QKW36670.1 hypothetical protein HUT06_23760 [Actinomadura sp. NAK00032]
MTRRSVLAVCAVSAAALALGGCGGGEKDAAEDGPSAAATTLAPLPAVKPSDVKPLVGRWVGTAEDYFQFKADGSGVWVRGGQKLWSGAAIPEGDGKFRFSWQGGDPRMASYWGVTLEDKSTLVFAGTNQKYKKAVAKKGKG